MITRVQSRYYSREPDVKQVTKNQDHVQYVTLTSEDIKRDDDDDQSRTHVKDPVVHVRVRWITEAGTDPACRRKKDEINVPLTFSVFRDNPACTL